MTRALLLSNSTQFGRGYLDHAMEAVLGHLGPVRRLVFVPYALHDQEAYARKAAERFAREGVLVERCTPDERGSDLLRRAEAVFVGGGNTFRLLLALQETGHLALLRDLVGGGLAYLGASAGTNLAGPTIRTTNDMPIVEPRGFAALGLLPFQINPHYLDPDPGSRHMGETREDRIREFLEDNETAVLGIREGTWLRREGEETWLEGGPGGGRLFRRGRDPLEVTPGTLLEPLLG